MMRWKTTVSMLVAAVLAGTVLIGSRAARAEDETAATYRAKCFGCHGAAADKRFNAALPEQEMIDAILKGKKAEKPPHMPAYADKGITADQAKALVDYMKQLKK